MSKRQSGLAFVGAAVLLAVVWVAPASAIEMPPIKVKPAATSTATKVAMKRPVAQPSATRRPIPDYQVVRVAAVERRTNGCNFFFCWREFPLLLGIGF